LPEFYETALTEEKSHLNDNMLKSIQRKFKTVANNPKTALIKTLYVLSPLFSDRAYLKMLFPLKVGYKLDLANPKTFNEKLQWLKINYRKPEMPRMVDKYEAKRWAAGIIGKEFIIDTYGVWNSFDEIDFDSLPDSFVLKTTHDQGGVVVVRDKEKWDKEAAKRKLAKHLKRQHYYLTREWPYKNVKPRILAEALLCDGDKAQPNDYKFYCFNGRPRILLVATERSSGNAKFDYFDMEFRPVDLKQGGERSGRTLAQPLGFRTMIRLAERLASDLPHVRVDFYDIEGAVYFGEMTFFDGGGMALFEPQIVDRTWGDWIDLEKVV